MIAYEPLLGKRKLRKVTKRREEATTAIILNASKKLLVVDLARLPFLPKAKE